MPYPEPYKRKNSPYYQFVYTDAAGKRIQKSTKFSTKRDAKEFIEDFMNRQRGGYSELTFREYADPYYDWNRCPRIARLLAEGKQIGEEHARQSRLWLKNNVLADPLFSNLIVSSIRRRDILDFRARLMEKKSLGVVNKTIGVIKTILSEAVYREDIDSNPALQISTSKHRKKRLYPYSRESRYKNYSKRRRESGRKWSRIYCSSFMHIPAAGSARPSPSPGRSCRITR